MNASGSMRGSATGGLSSAGMRRPLTAVLAVALATALAGPAAAALGIEPGPVRMPAAGPGTPTPAFAARVFPVVG